MIFAVNLTSYVLVTCGNVLVTITSTLLAVVIDFTSSSCAVNSKLLLNGLLTMLVMLQCGSTSGPTVMATKRSFVKNENQGSCQRRALGVYTWDIA